MSIIDSLKRKGVQPTVQTPYSTGEYSYSGTGASRYDYAVPHYDRGEGFAVSMAERMETERRWNAFINERERQKQEAQREARVSRFHSRDKKTSNRMAEYDPGGRRTAYISAQMDNAKAQEELRRASFTAGPVTPEHQQRVDSARSAVNTAQQNLTQAKTTLDAYEPTKEPDFQNWEGRDELVQEYQRLQTRIDAEERRLERGGPGDPAQLKRDKQQLEEIRRQLEEGDANADNGAADYSFTDRAESVIGGTAKNIGSSLGKTGAVIWDFMQQAGAYDYSEAEMRRDAITGRDILQEGIDAYNSEEAKAKRQAMYDAVGALGESGRADLERAKNGLSGLGKAGVDIASNLLEMGFDATTAALTGGSSLAIMFTRVFGDEAYQALSDGATLNQAVLFGAAKGGIEAFTEKLADGVAGIYGRGAADDITEALIRRMAETSTGQNMLRAMIGAFNEGAEEVLSDLLAPLADRIYKEDAWKDGYFSSIDPSEVLYDFLIGAAVGGFGSAGGRLSGQYAAKNAENAYLGAMYEQAGETPSFRQEVKDRGIIQRDAEGFYTPENQTVQQQVQEAEQAMSRQTPESVRAQQLNEASKGVQQKSAGELLTMVFNGSGIPLTEQEHQTLTELAVEGTAPPSKAVMLMRTAYDMGEQGAELPEVQAALNGSGLTDNQIRRAWGFGGSVQTARTGSADVNTEEGRTKLTATLKPLGTHAAEAFELYKKGQDVWRYAAAMQKAAFLYAANTGDVAKIAEDAREGRIADSLGYLSDDQLKLAQKIGAEQRQQKQEAVKKLGAERAALREQAAEITKGRTVTAEALAQTETALEEARAASTEAKKVYSGIVSQMEAMQKADPKEWQSESFQAAYDALVEQQDAAMQQVKALDNQIRELEKKTAEIKGRKVIQRKKGTVSYAGGTMDGKSYEGVDPSKLTRQQKKVTAMVDALADAVNLDYVIFSGEAKVGGMYKNGRIWVNINFGMGVGEFNQTIAAASLSHELTHFLQEYAPEEYQQLKDFVVQEILKVSPEELSRLVAERQRWNTQRALSYDEALDEVVADGCQTMLLNSKAIRKLARENMTLAEKIADFIEDFTNKIRDAFAEVDPSQGQVFDAVRALEGSLEQMQELWDEGVEAALQSYNAEQTVLADVAESATTENAAQNIGGVKYQKQDEKTDSIRVQIQNAQDKLNKMEPVASISAKDMPNNVQDRRKWAYNRLKSTGFKVERQGFGTIIFDDSHIDEAFRHILNKPDEMCAVLAVPRVLKRGELIHSHELHKNRQADSFTIAAPIVVDGVRGNMGIVVQRTTKNFYHAHRFLLPNGASFTFEEAKKKAASKRAGELPDNQALIAKPIESASNNSIADSAPESKAQNQFIGESAETADKEALARARELDKQGVDNESIRQQTGWFKGMDGKWRYEIPGNRMEYYRFGDASFRQDHPEYAEYQDLMDKVLTGELTEAEEKRLSELDRTWGNEIGRLSEIVERGSGTLDMILQFDELFEAYPQLRKIRVEFDDLGKQGLVGSYDDKRKTIVLGNHLKRDTIRAKAVLAHEIQHAIQHIEGFTPGASLEYWSYRLNAGYRQEVEKKADQKYNALFDGAPEELKNKIRAYNRARIDKNWELADKIENELYDSEYADLFSAIDNADFERRNARYAEYNPVDMYYNTAGEIEARDAERRSTWDESKRKLTAPNLGNSKTIFSNLDDAPQFQMLGEVEETPRLVAVHNVTEEKLLPALKLGGLPVPSIAIVKAKSGHSNYGPISLVFAKKTIDPQADRRNKVYGADAWTQMRADVEYQVNDDAVFKAESMIDRLAAKVAGGMFSNGSVLRQYGIERATALDYDSILQKIAASDTARAAYAAAHGIDVEPVYRQKVFSNYGNDVLQMYIDRIGEDNIRRLEEQLENGNWDLSAEDMQDLQDTLRENFLKQYPSKPHIAEKRAANIASNDRYVKFINAAYAYMTSNGETTDEVDRLATGEKLSEAVSSKDVVEWLRPQLTEVIGEPGIRNRTDAYTADGRRRSFWQTHDTYTLANIVKAMTSGNARGAGIHLGATHLQSITATDYSNVDSMKKDAGRLRRTTEEEYSAEVSAVDDQLQKLVNDIAAFNGDESYFAKDTIGEVLIESARGKQTAAGIQQSFKRLSEYTLSKELAEQVLSAYQAAANLPTEYFEAKPQRAVGFDEVISAIIPDNASSTLKAALQRAGVHVDEYKAGDEQDRLQKLNSVEGAQFQRWDNTDGDTAAEANGREQSYARIAAENAVVADTIAALKKLTDKQAGTIAKLQKRLQITKTPEVRDGDARKLARSILKEYGSRAEVDGISDKLKALGDYIFQTKASELKQEEVKNRAREIASTIIDSANEKIRMEDETLTAIRGSIKGKKLTFDPEFMGELDQAGGFDAVRKRSFGTFTVARADSTNIDRSEYTSVSQFYADLQSTYGKGFFPDLANEGEELLAIAENARAAAPMEVNPYEQYMGEAVEHLANQISMDVLNGMLRPTPPTDADRAKTRRDELNRHIKELVAENKMQKKEAAELWATISTLSQALDKAEAQYETLKADSEARTMQVFAEGKARETEIQARERARAAEKIQALKEHYKEVEQNARERRKESAGISKYREQVFRKAGKLREMLIKNDDKLHVPEVLKAPLAAFLESLNFTSTRALRGGAETNADRAFAANLQKIQQILSNQQDYINGGDMKENMGGYIDVSPDSMDFLRRVSEMITTALSENRDYTINQMSAAELKDLSNFLSNLRTAINGMNQFMANARFESVREAASADIQTIQELGRVSTAENGKLFHAAAWENGTPYYIFRRLGEGGKAIFDALTRGWEKMALNVKEIMDFTAKAYTDKEVRDWQKETHAITLEDGSEITMTTAQIMSLSMLLNREQARKHMDKGGVRIGDIQGKKGITTDTRHHHLTDADIKDIVGLLTPRQAQVAKALQTFMAVKGAEWGNEISMRRFGYRFYTEGDTYFPIKTDSTDRPMSDTDAQQNSMFRLLNLSASKSVNPKATNALVVEDIFDVFADHMSDMAKLNGMGLPILDAIKWFNFKERIDLGDGQYDTRTMQGAMEEAFGKQALSYFRTLMKDINGVTESGDRGTGFWSKLLSNYKAAAVGANLRVAFLQPTSYVRASYLIKPRYLLQAFTSKNAYKEAMENSGTAVWKSLGYYDTNIARGMRDQIKHNDGWRDKIVEKSMALAEFGDKRTWGRLWVACKMQAEAETGKTGNELIQATADLFREVIYSSQVMDSTLTRSELMRGKSQYTKALTAFMAEPTLSYNMVMDAAMEYNMNARRYGKGEAWKRSRGYITKAVSVYVCSAAFSAVVESIADAFRDDDDYEDFLLKWSQAMFGEGNFLSGNLAQDLSLFGKLPYIKNLMSALQGYKNKDMSTAALDSILDTYKIWKETIDLATGELDKATKTTYYGKMTTWGKIYKTLQGISQLSGIAVANMTRDVTALWNTTVGAMYPEYKVKTYDAGPKKAIQDAVENGYMTAEEAEKKLLDKGLVEDADEAYLTVKSWETGDSGKYTGALRAAFGGDQAAFKAEMQDLAGHGVKEKNVRSAVKGFVRDAFMGKELSEEEQEIVDGKQLTDEQARRMLNTYGGMSVNKAVETVANWKKDKEFQDKNGWSYSNRKSLYIDDEINRQDLKKALMDYEKMSASDAEEKIKEYEYEKTTGHVWSERKADFQRGDITRANMLQYLQKYGGLTRQEAEEKVEVWEWQKGVNGAEGITASAVKKYNKYCSQAGVKKETFVKVWKAYNDTEAAYDANGEPVANSKTVKVMPQINALPISAAQKTAIALCFWSLKTVNKYKVW